MDRRRKNERPQVRRQEQPLQQQIPYVGRIDRNSTTLHDLQRTEECLQHATDGMTVLGRPGQGQHFPRGSGGGGGGQMSSQGRPQIQRRPEKRIERKPDRNRPELSPAQCDELLLCNRVMPLEKPSSMFPNAKWFCRLCHQHFNQLNTSIEHCYTIGHSKKKSTLDLRKVVMALPKQMNRRHLQGVSCELERVYHTNYISEQMKQERQNVLRELDTYLSDQLVGATLNLSKEQLAFKLLMQGSSLSGLGLRSSDVNVDMQLTETSMELQAKIFFEVLRLLQKFDKVSHVEAHFNSKVPKIKMLHLKTKLHVEIGLGGGGAWKTNKLLQDYSSIDSRVGPLSVCFRYWAGKCRLDDPSQGSLPPHAFPIMTVYYLQQCRPPVLPCLHEASRAELDASGQEDSYVPPELSGKPWKTQNEQCLGELWIGMLRFYAAEFKLRKVCISLRVRKPLPLVVKGWASRYIGIEDPFCKKKSLAKSMANDQIMTYFLFCLRTSALYFSVPRTSADGPLYRPEDELDLGKVEDPEGDDIEDGLAVNEDEAEDEKDDDVILEPIDQDPPDQPVLKGWYQNLSKHIVDRVNSCKKFNYSLESVHSLTGGAILPKVCVTCRQTGHTTHNCSESQLPKILPVSEQAVSLLQDMHTELCRYIHKNFRPAISEVELHYRIVTVKQLEEYIQKDIPDAYLTLFGSSRNGFSLEKADLDICLKFKDKEDSTEVDVQAVIQKIASLMKSHIHIAQVQAIVSAKVPIVKFHHTVFGVDGDISLYNVLAEHNTAMLKVYSEVDERVVYLGAALKQFVKLCDMGDASRGSLSSYAYIILLIHYLQQQKVVPVLQKIFPKDQSTPPVDQVDGWNAYYFNDINNLRDEWPHFGKNNKSVGELWLGLIDYYATKFKFDLNVVCIRQEEPLTRLEKMWTNKDIGIEDPFELDHNLGTGVSVKMARYIFSALITSRNWFLTPPRRQLTSGQDIYRHYMNSRDLVVGKPPNDRGCKRCGKIGHWIKDCPLKQAAEGNNTMNGDDRRRQQMDRRVCHNCGQGGHIIKNCPLRLQQQQKRTDVKNVNDAEVNSGVHAAPGRGFSSRDDSTSDYQSTPRSTTTSTPRDSNQMSSPMSQFGRSASSTAATCAPPTYSEVNHPSSKVPYENKANLGEQLRGYTNVSIPQQEIGADQTLQSQTVNTEESQEHLRKLLAGLEKSYAEYDGSHSGQMSSSMVLQPPPGMSPMSHPQPHPQHTQHPQMYPPPPVAMPAHIPPQFYHGVAVPNPQMQMYPPQAYVVDPRFNTPMMACSPQGGGTWLPPGRPVSYPVDGQYTYVEGVWAPPDTPTSYYEAPQH